MADKEEKYNTDDFTSNIVAVVIAVIVIAAVAVPIINGMIGAEGSGKPIVEGSTTATIVGVIPIFLVLAVLMMVVYMFLSKQKE